MVICVCLSLAETGIAYTVICCYNHRRIRQSSVALLGDLLYLLGDTKEVSTILKLLHLYA
jgi:hypothetical protein